ncbi:MAG: S41 family peptidase [Clostridia bacterium]|nr:S41 family peptidase [Clostridia bacterium]
MENEEKKEEVLDFIDEKDKKTPRRMRNSSAFVLIALGMILSAVITFFITAFFINSFNPLGLSRENWVRLKWGFEAVDKMYYKEVDEGTLVDGALLGLSSALDEYSIYMPKDYAEDFKQSVDADEYCGVGLYIYSDTEADAVKVMSAISGSPAKKAGITTDDIIKAVDGEAVYADVDKASSKMLGEEGTEVTVTILKANSGKTVDIKLKRAKIKIETVQSEMKNGNIGYIAISQFGVNTYSEFVEHFNKLAEDGAEKIVLDLRSNPGGYFSSAIEIADIFLDKGETIVYTKDKNGKKEEYKAKSEEMDVEMAILCDEGTASASEVLIGALRDNERAVLVGTKTFGKGVTQALIPYPDGSAFKITDSNYYTPKGESIDKKGIEPDFKVENRGSTDLQLEKALEILE